MVNAVIYTLVASALFISLSKADESTKIDENKGLLQAIYGQRFVWPIFPWLTSTVGPVSRTTTRRTTQRRTTRTRATTGQTASTSTQRISSSATSTSSRPGSQFTSFQSEALAQTNAYRASHCAPPMVLNVTLNSVAQAYANELARTKSFQHSNNGYGENLYATFGSQGLTANSIKASTAIDSWYEEVDQYNWSSPGFTSGTGHFTQLVWISSQQLGMGVACSSDGKSCYVVANYWPAGNFQGRFPSNVKAKGSC